MNKQSTKIKKGELFLFSTGAYSDYEIKAVCKAKTDIDIKKIKQEYFELYPEQEADFSFQPYRFLKWVIVDKDLVKEVPCKEWYLGEDFANFQLREKSF